MYIYVYIFIYIEDHKKVFILEPKQNYELALSSNNIYYISNIATGLRSFSGASVEPPREEVVPGFTTQLDNITESIDTVLLPLIFTALPLNPHPAREPI